MRRRVALPALAQYYSAFVRASDDGDACPVQRPFIFTFNTIARGGAKTDDGSCLGEASVLVAPVLQAGTARRVTLRPLGRGRSFTRASVTRGGKSSPPQSLDHITLFARAERIPIVEARRRLDHG